MFFFRNRRIDGAEMKAVHDAVAEGIDAYLKHGRHNQKLHGRRFGPDTGGGSGGGGVMSQMAMDFDAPAGARVGGGGSRLSQMSEQEIESELLGMAGSSGAVDKGIRKVNVRGAPYPIPVSKEKTFKRYSSETIAVAEELASEAKSRIKSHLIDERTGLPRETTNPALVRDLRLISNKYTEYANLREKIRLESTDIYGLSARMDDALWKAKDNDYRVDDATRTLIRMAKNEGPEELSEALSSLRFIAKRSRESADALRQELIDRGPRIRRNEDGSTTEIDGSADRWRITDQYVNDVSASAYYDHLVAVGERLLEMGS